MNKRRKETLKVTPLLLLHAVSSVSAPQCRHRLSSVHCCHRRRLSSVCAAAAFPVFYSVAVKFVFPFVQISCNLSHSHSQVAPKSLIHFSPSADSSTSRPRSRPSLSPDRPSPIQDFSVI